VSREPTFYAYVITVRFQPATAGTVVAMYRERTAPLVAAAPGLIALLGLVQRATGRGIAIRVWQTAADRARSDVPSAAIVDDLADYAGLLTGTYTRDPYDVPVLALPPADPDRPFVPAVARVITEDIRPDRWDEGIAALHALDLRAARMDEHDAVARERGYLAKRVEREVYEVVARY
jgi:hypothetical protein